MNEDRATRYHRLNRRVTVVWILTAICAPLLLLQGGSQLLRDAIASRTAAGPSAPTTVALYALALIAGFHLLRLPVAFYQGSVLERRYGLSSATAKSWMHDYVKAAALTALLATAAAEVVYLTMGWWPRWWWVAAGLCFSAALAALTRIAPIVLLPMFYRFEPLERASLRERLDALSKRAGVPVLGAYVWGLGSKTSRANAALVGAGSSRRILLSDTLLSNYTDDEIEVILAHEIGHHVHRDIRTGLMFESVVTISSLGIGAAMLSWQWSALGLTAPSDVAGLPLLFVAAALVTLATTPALNALSRRNERRADRYAIGLTGGTAAFISAMRRVGVQNLAESRPSRAALWFFHTHPSIEERIDNARRGYHGSDP